MAGAPFQWSSMSWIPWWRLLMRSQICGQTIIIDGLPIESGLFCFILPTSLHNCVQFSFRTTPLRHFLYHTHTHTSLMCIKHIKWSVRHLSVEVIFDCKKTQASDDASQVNCSQIHRNQRTSNRTVASISNEIWIIRQSNEINKIGTHEPKSVR